MFRDRTRGACGSLTDELQRAGRTCLFTRAKTSIVLGARLPPTHVMWITASTP
jgi:hypothetical protein